MQAGVPACPLLALSGHGLSHCTCLLLGVKRTLPHLQTDRSDPSRHSITYHSANLIVLFIQALAYLNKKKRKIDRRLPRDVRVPLMPALPQPHTISAAEVKAWFGPRAKGRLEETQYALIAQKLNRLRWPTDPSAQNARAAPEVDPYWDFSAATKAAKFLLAAMPAMKRHWQGLTWAPETRVGYTATEILEHALRNALPFIEWPFGPYQRAIGRKQRKAWQLPSVMVARVLAQAMVTSRRRPSLERHAVLVRVTREALERMGYNLTNVGTSGISAYLARWDKQFGRIRPRERR